MIACYILLSKKLNKFYVGITQDSIQSRLGKHNTGFYNGTYSKITNDWELFLVIECDSVSQSMLIEKHIKKMKSKIYIENLLKYPEIIKKLKQKFNVST
jgi:putative endonuclease